jgi:hypothetical protein
MSAFRFDGRGVWPWLLVALYTLAPFAIFLMQPPPFADDPQYPKFVIGMVAVTLALGALGPFLIVMFLCLALGVLSGQVPYLGDCKSLGEEAIIFVPLVLALPLACMVTSAIIYHLGRSALAPNSRMLGNLVFPFVGLVFGWATLWLMGHRIDVALQAGTASSGG